VSLGYAYDQTGNRLLLAEAAKTISYHYDGLNRLTGLGDGVTLPPPTTNRVAWWKGEGSGADEQGTNPGILRNGVSFAAGFAGQAFRFDGVDDEIGFTSAVGSLGYQATVELWIKTTSTRRETIMSDRLTCTVTTPASAAAWELQLQANGTVGFAVAGPDPWTGGTTFAGTTVGTTHPVNDGQWHRIAAVRAGSEQRLYLDGQLEGYWNYLNGAPVLTGLPAGGLHIGTGGCGTSLFTGQLDEITMADRVWTLAELQAPRSQEQPVANWTYDALSRRTAMTLPNGIRTTYQYDPASQVTNILHQLTATSTQINKADYVYNLVGNRTSLTDRRGNQAFGYDQLDRLTSASHPLLLDPQAFVYDPVGNRTTGGSVVNTGNQLTADANFAYQYDDNGNLTRKTLLATGNYSQYTYDAENRLTQVQEFAAGNPTAITTSSYRYDGLGRRIEKVANGQTKRYIYDGEDILLEYNGSNVLQARYTHGPGIDEPLSRTPVTPGVGSGHQAVLASTPDGLRGPVVDDGITVNGQVSVGFVLASGVPTPAVGQPIDSTGSHQPVAPIDVTAASATGTLAVDLVDTGGIGGNAPVFLVTRDQATGQVIESRLLFPARATFASTTPLGTPLVVASTTVGVTTPVANGTLFYHQDGLGSVTDLTDSVGATAKSYSYDAYGNILESPGAVDQPYTYTGRELDSETGLYYYRARYYDATTGRFLQKDPVGLKAGPNGYWYANANPVFFVDPFGLMSRAQCDELRARIFRKVGDLIDDLIRYDPVADGIGGHPTSGGKKTSPGGHHNEIQERQWGIGKALAKYAKECTKRCNDGPPPPPLPEWVEEVATRPIPDVVYPIPQGPMLMGPVDSVPFPELPEFMVRPTFPRPFVIP
jgi:RHS repeat-associated protein